MQFNNLHIFQVRDSEVEPEWTLLYYLRNKRILIRKHNEHHLGFHAYDALHEMLFDEHQYHIAIF